MTSFAPNTIPAGGIADSTERRITDFQPDDAAAVAVMFNDSEEGWPGGFNQGIPMTAERVLHMVQHRRPLATLIAWDGEAVAGYCALYEQPDEPGMAGHIGLLNVAASFQGRGHGRDLLREALQRALSAGHRRLDLGTWPGNMKAVPLYKKSGYFWMPETTVHMQNYMPLLLSIPALAEFWHEVDWYTTQIRDLSVKEDLYLQGKMRVYPYEFRHGDRYVRATIDAAAQGLTAIETECWRVSCTVDDRRLIVGRPRTIRWEVENRTGRPMPLTLVATAGAGLRLAVEETTLVQDRYVAETRLTADQEYQPPSFGRRAPRVESLILLDGMPIHLETGVEIHQPLDVRLEPRRATIIPGRVSDLILQVRNTMDEPASARLRFAPSSGIRVLPDAQIAGDPLQIDLAVDAESYAGQRLRVVADEAGAHNLGIYATALVDGEQVAMAPVTIPLPAAGPGDMVPLITTTPLSEHNVQDRELRVETATQRLVVQLREGNFHLEDSRTGTQMLGGRIMVGPPFSWMSQSRVVHEATYVQRGGTTVILLRGTAPHLPNTAIEHELHMSVDGLLRVATSFSNLGNAAQEYQGAIWIWGDRTEVPTCVMPTIHGLVASADVEFPDWSDPALQSPSSFTENWIALQGDDRVAAVLWAGASRIEPGHWSINVHQDTGILKPGGQRTLPPIYLFAGPGNWHAVRARWRSLLQPDAPSHGPEPREITLLEAEAAPAALLAGTTNTLMLSSMANREASGELRLDAPGGWEISPAAVQLQGLRVARPREIRVAVRNRESGPRASVIQGTWRAERSVEQVFDGSLIDLGRGDAVRIVEQEGAAERLFMVDNGFMRFRLAPAFMGSVVALETEEDGINHLFSAFPTPREFGWINPWYGGLHAVVYNPGAGEFPDPARMYEEKFGVEEATEDGHDGRHWRGLRVYSSLQGKGLRGLELQATYLTLPGSNVLAARVTVRNRTTAMLPVQAALIGYVQPGGSIDNAELLLNGRTGHRRLLRAQRTEDFPSDGWVGVRNPRSGRTIALVSDDQAVETAVYGVDWGIHGAHTGARFTLRLGPGEEHGAWSYLVIAREEEEARAYGVLGGARGLL